MLRRMIAIVVLVVFAFSILGGLLYYFYSRTLEKQKYLVVEPALGRPVIVPRGGSFAIRISAPAGVELDKVLLGPAVGRGIGNYEISVINAGKSPMGTLSGAMVKTPYALPTGLYDLVVQFRMGAVNYIEDRPSAVNIVEPDEAFSFAVMGDPGNPGQGGFSTREVSRLKGAAHELSMLNPDFLVVLGGFGSGPWYARNYKVFKDILHDELLVPAIVLPKAEDLSATSLLGYKLSDGAAQWRGFFPLKPYTFDRAGYRFVFMFAEPCPGEAPAAKSQTAGCMGEKSLSWLKELVEESEDKKLVLFLPDTPLTPGGEGFRGALDNLLDARGQVNLLKILKGRETVIFTSGIGRDAAYDIGEDARLINTGRDGASSAFLPRYRIVSAGEKGLAEVHYRSAPNAITFDRLRITYANPNDGTASRNRIVVTNELGRDLSDLRALAALAPPKAGDYEVAGADVKMRIKADKHFFLLSFDVKKSGRKIITIKQRSEERGDKKEEKKEQKAGSAEQGKNSDSLKTPEKKKEASHHEQKVIKKKNEKKVQ